MSNVVSKDMKPSVSKSNCFKSAEFKSNTFAFGKIRHFSEVKVDVKIQEGCNHEEVRNCSGCRGSLKGSGDPKVDMVKLFKHVHAAGLSNFQCCQITVCQPTLNLAVWREKLEG